jgi:hypothetical protein
MVAKLNGINQNIKCCPAGTHPVSILAEVVSPLLAILRHEANGRLVEGLCIGKLALSD